MNTNFYVRVRNRLTAVSALFLSKNLWDSVMEMNEIHFKMNKVKIIQIQGLS